MHSALYFPVLRAKQGEIDGLAHISPWCRSRARPLVDIPLQKDNDSRTLEQYLAETLGAVTRSHGTGSPLYVDLSQYGPNVSVADGRHPVELAYDIIAQLRLMAIPVTGPESIRGEGKRYIEAVNRIAEFGGLGCGLRVPIADFRTSESIQRELERALVEQDLDPATTDLFLDAEALERLPSEYVVDLHLERTVRDVLNAIQNVPFRTLVFVGSSVPQNVGPEFNAKPHRVHRAELSTWTNLIAEESCQGLLFGDYTVIPPFQSDVSKPVRAPSRIRLSNEEEHVLFRGPRGEHRALCRKVLEKRAHIEQAPSWGLAATAACGRGSGGIGGPTDWVARDVNMHIESTVKVVERCLENVGFLSMLSFGRYASEPWLQSELNIE